MLARYNRWNRPEEDEEEEGILVGGTTVCRGKQDGDVFPPTPLGQSLLNPTLVQQGKELHFFVLEADFLPHGARTVGVIIVPCFVAGCSPSLLPLFASKCGARSKEGKQCVGAEAEGRQTWSTSPAYATRDQGSFAPR